MQREGSSEGREEKDGICCVEMLKAKEVTNKRFSRIKAICDE
jgi:hypothetical protein